MGNNTRHGAANKHVSVVNSIVSTIFGIRMYLGRIEIIVG